MTVCTQQICSKHSVTGHPASPLPAVPSTKQNLTMVLSTFPNVKTEKRDFDPCEPRSLC